MFCMLKQNVPGSVNLINIAHSVHVWSENYNDYHLQFIIYAPPWLFLFSTNEILSLHVSAFTKRKITYSLAKLKRQTIKPPTWMKSRNAMWIQGFTILERSKDLILEGPKWLCNKITCIWGFDEVEHKPVCHRMVWTYPGIEQRG